MYIPLVGDDVITAYTDGAVQGNPSVGGWGAYLFDSKGREKEIKGSFKFTTNNRMELYAAISALETIKEGSRVNIYSDSMYVVESVVKKSVLKWRHYGWHLNPTRTKKTLNPDLWIRLLAAIERHTEVQFMWVKAHSGIKGNEIADRLAASAIMICEKIEDTEYIKSINLEPQPSLF